MRHSLPVRPRALPALLIAGLAAAPALPAAADTIHRTTGEPIEDCTVVEETLTSVIYTVEGRRGDERAVPSDTVLDVEYTKRPELVDEAETLFFDGDLQGAIDAFGDYLKETAEKVPRREKWAPAYAARRTIEIYMTMGDMAGALKAADALIQRFPDSRFLPDAYLAKSEAQFWAQDLPAARQTLTAFQKVVEAKGLGDRWRLECRLGLLATDDKLTGDQRRAKLQEIVGDAGGEHPTVRNRALVAIGESHLQDGQYEPARAAFTKVVEDPRSDPGTLAGAYSGLGDCLYETGIAKNDKELVRQALMNYMRVVVNHKDQSRLAARAMFYAGRCFDNLGSDEDKDRAQKLYRAVMRDFPGSTWAEEAKNFRG